MSLTKKQKVIRKLKAIREKQKTVPASRGRQRAIAGADVKPRPGFLIKPSAEQAPGVGFNAVKDMPTKRDFNTGRTLFPTHTGGGKVQYLPRKSEATARELQRGLFVSNESVTVAPANTLLKAGSVNKTSLRDFNTGRTVFATQDANGETEYLPRQSEATAQELLLGKYVLDDQVETPAVPNVVLKEKPVLDLNYRRLLYPTRDTNGETEYLPGQSEATAQELFNGRYIPEQNVPAQKIAGLANPLENRATKFDFTRQRKVYPIKNVHGKVLYLPRLSDALPDERARGIFIPDDIVNQHEQSRRKDKNDPAELAKRRADRAHRLHGKPPGGVPPYTPVHKAKDGTPLWDGVSAIRLSEQKQQSVLVQQRKQFDPYRQRMLYQTQTARGQLEWLPLHADATAKERIEGRYVAFVPPESLAVFIQQRHIDKRHFDTAKGELESYAKADIAQALEQTPQLVLHSARFVSDTAKLTPALQQASLKQSVISQDSQKQNSPSSAASHRLQQSLLDQILSLGF
ncbi:hypothetical protein [Aliikangiella coralliicola]|uniref:Uncharacterized protein n=1 Tax=Aliikangiella coralliicola TaxID=2592383 RepID=A0A545U8Z9_9GAMM|nr:hypothetical protein [Aliikangiella coralliicola]TQV85946.1 hypothetical protein FLL46_18685 [Aliikangiella coralliicola]